MVRIIQKFLKPANYRGAGDYPASRLSAAMKETNRALGNGLAIPVIGFHTNPDDPKGLPAASRDACEISKGWLKGVRQNDDGSLEHELEITDPKAAEAIANGSIRFTSPQITTQFTDGLGRSYGEMFTHVALTPRPRNPDQGPMVVSDGNSTQFSLEDAMDDENEKPDEKTPVDADPKSESPPVTEEPNPDLLPEADDAKKAEAAIAALNTLGVVVPADWTPTAEKALDILLAALNTAATMKAKADTEKTVATADQPPEPTQAPVQFSLEQLAALPADVQAALKQAKKDRETAIQFSLEKADLKRSTTVANVKAMKLPKGLKDKLVKRLETVQFSATGEADTMTVAEVAKLVSESLPPSIQFDNDPKPIPPPEEAGGQPTDEDIKKRVDEQLKQAGFRR